MFASRRAWWWKPRIYMRAWLVAISVGLFNLIMLYVLSHDWASALTAATAGTIGGGLAASHMIWWRKGARVSRRLAAFLPRRRTSDVRARYVPDPSGGQGTWRTFTDTPKSR
jgi:hypothetical protein